MSSIIQTLEFEIINTKSNKKIYHENSINYSQMPPLPSQHNENENNNRLNAKSITAPPSPPPKPPKRTDPLPPPPRPSIMFEKEGDCETKDTPAWLRLHGIIITKMRIMNQLNHRRMQQNQ
eukprot:516947_1